jgi:hypothetical protein
MSADQHPILYYHSLTQTERIAYVNNYIYTNIIPEHLPTHVVEAELRPGSIPADYIIFGLLINGKFVHISIHFGGIYAG